MRWIALVWLVGCSVAIDDYETCELELGDFEMGSCGRIEATAFAACTSARQVCTRACPAGESSCRLVCLNEEQICQGLIFERNPLCADCYIGSLLQCYAENGCEPEVQDSYCCEQACDFGGFCECEGYSEALDGCALPHVEVCGERALDECLDL